MQTIYETLKAYRRETRQEPTRLALHPAVHRDVIAQIRGAEEGDVLQAIFGLSVEVDSELPVPWLLKGPEANLQVLPDT